MAGALVFSSRSMNNEVRETAEHVAVARDELGTTPDEEQRSEPVVLQLEEPVELARAFRSIKK
jgi:hypothetical protein